MKKSFLIAAFALGTLAASAQTVSLSTYKGTDIAKFDGQALKVSVSRYVLNGWNTISLPFAVPAEMVEEVFGSDCRLEKLVGAEGNASQITLNFMDCKAEGMEAGAPYILYYSGQPTVKRIVVDNAVLQNTQSPAVFRTVGGVEVTFAGVQQQKEGEGLYGILAKDNAEATFVNAGAVANGFFATRCSISLSSGTYAQITTNHLSAGEATSVSTVLRTNEKADVYSLSGTKVANGLNANSIGSLPAGVYVVNGKKVTVR